MLIVVLLNTPPATPIVPLFPYLSSFIIIVVVVYVLVTTMLDNPIASVESNFLFLISILLEDMLSLRFYDPVRFQFILLALLLIERYPVNYYDCAKDYAPLLLLAGSNYACVELLFYPLVLALLL